MSGISEELAKLANARVLFWMCPDQEHERRLDEHGQQLPIVEWRGEVAYCLTEGCGKNSSPSSDDAAVVLLDNEPCGKTVGSKPWWMGDGQYESSKCTCLLTKGHDGDCACTHTAPDSERSE